MVSRLRKGWSWRQTWSRATCWWSAPGRPAWWRATYCAAAASMSGWSTSAL